MQTHKYTHLDTQFHWVPEPIHVHQTSRQKSEEEAEKNKMVRLSRQLHQKSLHQRLNIRILKTKNLNPETKYKSGCQGLAGGGNGRKMVKGTNL